MKTEVVTVTSPVVTHKTVATFTLQIGVNEASYLHAMMDPRYFLSANELTDMEKEAYQFGIELKQKLGKFVQEHHPENQNDS